MHSYIFKKASTNISIELEILDSTVGTPETGVVWNTAGLDLQYRRDGEASTAITEATLAALTTAHTDGGFIHIGNGVYRLDLPDAALATGANKVIVHGTVTGMVVVPAVIQLVDYDPFDVVRMGMTALPNAAADAAGGLAISDAGGLDLDAKIGALTYTVANQLDANAVAISGDATAAMQAGLATEAKQDIIDTNIDSIVTQVGTAGAGLTDLGGMSASMKAEILAEAIKLLTTQMTESYAADGTAPTLAQALFLVQQSLHEFAIASTTRTVKKLDGTTTAATFTLDDATNPTSTTRAT